LADGGALAILLLPDVFVDRWREVPALIIGEVL